MRKIRFFVICFSIIWILGFSGCGSRIPDMTDEQREAISQYAVDLLLKYDTSQPSRLVDLEKLEKEEAAKPSKPVATQPPKENTGMDETDKTPVIDLNGDATENIGRLETVLGLKDGISIEFVGFETLKNYQDPAVKEFMIEAENGKNLLVCEFVLMNSGADKQSVDMLCDNIQYMLAVDGVTSNCQMTMLSNDLTTYLGILDPDESRKVVVLAEVKEETLASAGEILLIMERGNAKTSVKIK